MTQNVVLDATVLTSLMNCARFSDLRFNHHLELISGKSNSLEIGSVVHKYLEIKYKCLINGLDKPTAHGMGMAAAELYVAGCQYCTNFVSTDEIPKPKCNHSPNEYPGIQNTPPESAGYLIGWKWALTTCEQYNEYYKNDHWVSLETEVVKGKIIYEDEDVRILWKAKLDWIVDTNQGIFPVDHKTMKQNRETISTNNQFMGQCLVMGTQSMIKNNIGFQKTLKPEEKFKREVISYTEDRLEEWRSIIVPYYAKLLLMYQETDFYPPNFSNCDGKFGKCQFYKDVCSNNRNMREDALRMYFKVGQEWNPTNDTVEAE